MIVVKEEIQSQYYKKAVGFIESYKALIEKVNGIFKNYGMEFYDFSRGKSQDDYFNNVKVKTKESIELVSRQAAVTLLDNLTELKKEYLTQAFAGESTNDSMELMMLGRELEVMNVGELKEFYIANITDQNKLRLFNIEVKKRSRSERAEWIADAKEVELFVQQFHVNDKATRIMDEGIRMFGGILQVAGSSFWVVSLGDYDRLVPRMIPFNDMFHFVEDKSSYGAPKEINILELRV